MNIRGQSPSSQNHVRDVGDPENTSPRNKPDHVWKLFPPKAQISRVLEIFAYRFDNEYTDYVKLDSEAVPSQGSMSRKSISQDLNSTTIDLWLALASASDLDHWRLYLIDREKHDRDSNAVLAFQK